MEIDFAPMHFKGADILKLLHWFSKQTPSIGFLAKPLILCANDSQLCHSEKSEAVGKIFEGNLK